MIFKKNNNPTDKLTPRDRVRLKMEQRERRRYHPDEESNIIFWNDSIPSKLNIIQKIRAYLWFYPDYVAKFVHKIRPLSYLVLYSLLTLLLIRTVTYASNNPQSILNPPEEKILYEGMVGNIYAINPLFITRNQIELDLQTLVFNRLLRISKDENPQPELAETWAVSSDNKSYTFFLRDDVTWHDGKKFTSEDVEFTFSTIKKLEQEESFSEALSEVNIQIIDDYTIVFELPEENATFMESLSVAIVPKHILEGISKNELRTSSFNQLPTGTGPYKVISSDEKGIRLDKNPSYFKGSPNIDGIEYKYYPDEESALLALKQFQIHNYLSASPSAVKSMSEYQVYSDYTFTIPLREKLIYFNLRDESSPLSNQNVRQAISSAINRTEIINQVQIGGEEAMGPISKNSWAYDSSVERFTYDQETANQLLDDAGWVFQEEESIRQKDGIQLSFTLTVFNSDENEIISQILRNQLAQVGVNIIIDTQEYDKISGETIPRRNFEALLFEIENIPEPDKYNLWHSIKSDYPGLNLSGYSFNRVDIILERARKESDQDVRKEDYSSFQKYIMKDVPAVYLYHPTYSFIVHKDITGIDLEQASLPQDRYLEIQNWDIN